MQTQHSTEEGSTAQGPWAELANDLEQRIRAHLKLQISEALLASAHKPDRIGPTASTSLKPPSDEPPRNTVGSRVIPVTKWNDYHDWPPVGGMRHLIFHAETNGFQDAFFRVGRSVLVDEAEFWRAARQTGRKQ